MCWIRIRNTAFLGLNPESVHKSTDPVKSELNPDPYKTGHNSQLNHTYISSTWKMRITKIAQPNTIQISEHGRQVKDEKESTVRAGNENVHCEQK
jgi:hypothetical protein